MAGHAGCVPGRRPREVEVAAVPASDDMLDWVLGIDDHDDLLGVRVVGGFAFWPRNTPLDIFVEVAPVVDLAPATDLSANGGIGIRFFFE